MRSRRWVGFLTWILSAGLAAPLSAAELLLDGASLSPAALVEAAAAPVRPVIDEASWQRVRDANTVLLAAAAQCQRIYGLTTGVGANKDHRELSCENLLDADGQMTSEAAAASSAFNTALLHAHGAGVDTASPPALVRAAMIARLNTALTGGSGMQEAAARQLAALLKHDILPVIPERGSVGEGDITLLSHIALVMQGLWQADHAGVRKTGSQALADAGLEPITLLGNDALATFSSNAFSAALAAQALADMRAVREMLAPVYGLSLEALNGNVAPLMAEPAALRPFPKVTEAAAELRSLLAGSYLFQPSETRHLQDPLSYRTGIYQIGALDRALDELEAVLTIQLNGADDNPVVYVGAVSPITAALPGLKIVDEPGLQGAVVPSSSFSALPQTLALQSAAIAAAHVSKGIEYRTLVLMNPDITRLSRFLAGPDAVHAFGAIHKPIGAVAAQNRNLADPASLDFVSLELEIEDMGTNAPRVARRLSLMADNLETLLGFELLLAAQAVDLRQAATPGLALAPSTATLHARFRAKVPFLCGDTTVLTSVITASSRFIEGLPVTPIPAVPCAPVTQQQTDN
ncbi:MAG: aromatic amino acid ammonia-lyase [Pseudomonadota bacterium]